MSKCIKIFSIIFIIFCILFSYCKVFATGIDMNLVPNELPSEEINDSNEESVTDENLTTPDTINPSSVGTVEEEGLGISNIFSILLITVGVILIFLAIAIFIRLK